MLAIYSLYVRTICLKRHVPFNMIRCVSFSYDRSNGIILQQTCYGILLDDIDAYVTLALSRERFERLSDVVA